ncbi:unnamed protein product, partial [Owenia fusiformis]
MGCTPSIHVSQTGVVYCRDSDESTSPRPSNLTGATGTKISDTATGSGARGGSSIQGSSSGKYRALETRRGTIEAETQTSHMIMKVSSDIVTVLCYKSCSGVYLFC